MFSNMMFDSFLQKVHRSGRNKTVSQIDRQDMHHESPVGESLNCSLLHQGTRSHEAALGIRALRQALECNGLFREMPNPQNPNSKVFGFDKPMTELCLTLTLQNRVHRCYSAVITTRDELLLSMKLFGYRGATAAQDAVSTLKLIGFQTRRSIHGRISHAWQVQYLRAPECH